MTKIAINGFGRIGRLTFRVLLTKPGIEVVAINDLTDTKTLAHLLKYDSVHGKFNGTVSFDEHAIIVNGSRIPIFTESEPENLPWKEKDIDVVIESTGRFTEREKAAKHIKAGAKKVVISAPGKGNDIKVIVLGVNENILDKNDAIISNASCTTNCLAPMVKIIDDLCGIDHGFMTTTHAYTADQRLHDAPHHDLRRARAAAYSIIPTSTGAAKAVSEALPHLKGKLNGIALRVPIPDGSITDFVCEVKNPKTVEEINAAFKAAAAGAMKGIVEYSQEPLVSIDIVGNTHSCIFDSELTMVYGNTVKVVGWYDNEVGYSNRIADLVVKLA
ncbi:MAG: type I glyceraldehyde-3-phosphate dehydrogenase [Bacteroidetes bacterium]|nr:type I glyceraldehyde-3-phosphate dehydrogenase [Bacteroidota bacterium]